MLLTVHRGQYQPNEHINKCKITTVISTPHFTLGYCNRFLIILPATILAHSWPNIYVQEYFSNVNQSIPISPIATSSKSSTTASHGTKKKTQSLPRIIKPWAIWPLLPSVTSSHTIFLPSLCLRAFALVPSAWNCSAPDKGSPCHSNHSLNVILPPNLR